MKLTKGGNTPIPTSLLTVVLSWQSQHSVDVHALLLSDTGQVRSDHDFVFFNAPRHVSQAVTLDQQPMPRTARLSVSLPRTQPDVARIVVTGSVEGGSFSEVGGLILTVFDDSRPVAWFGLEDSDSVQAMMFGEFYRRDEQWRFRAIGQGWTSGLAGIVTEFGVRIEESGDIPPERPDVRQPRRVSTGRQAIGISSPPTVLPPPHAERADWHPDPEDDSRMRWWDGTQWTSSTYPVITASSRACVRCGRPRRWRLFGTPAPCHDCAAEIEEYLDGWRDRAWRVLTTTGSHGEDWDALWTALRYRRIDDGAALTVLRPLAHDYVERLAAFAFADGEVEEIELNAFEEAVAALDLGGLLIEDLRRRMYRGRTLSRLRGGTLPTIRVTGLHLAPEEKVHLDTPAIHTRHLAGGPKRTEGRLICSNKKLRFVGTDIGIEMPWSRIISVTTAGGTVAVAATSARGGATFEVADPDYVAAMLEGTLRVAKRLALTPGQRDTRTIPQEIKAEVWQRDGGTCVECGDRHYLEFDHIIPLSRGGATSAANLQILCRACNRAKGARI